MKPHVEYIEIGSAGIGKIEAHEWQNDRLEEVTDRVGSGEFHVRTNETIPVCCIDGRCAKVERYLPCAAGGTETLTIADDLTTRRFADSDDLVSAHANLALFVTQQGHLVGSHTGPHANAELGTADCGASDRLAEIYQYINTHADTLKQLAIRLGFSDKETLHESIVARARARTQFPRSVEMVDTIAEVSGADSRDELEGDHAEVLAVINMREHTTLDHHAVQREFGDEYMSFNIDAWSFDAAARMIADSDEEVVAKTLAMAYYNLATAGVLCGPHMRLAVLR